MERFEKRDINIFYKDFFVCLPHDEFRYGKGTKPCFRFLW